jgi:hypothetical protein
MILHVDIQSLKAKMRKVLEMHQRELLRSLKR